MEIFNKRRKIGSTSNVNWAKEKKDQKGEKKTCYLHLFNGKVIYSMALEMVRFWQPSLAVQESWNGCWATIPDTHLLKKVIKLFTLESFRHFEDKNLMSRRLQAW